MTRRVREFVDVSEHISLDELIGRLVEIRTGLPEGSEAELKLRGDDVFGRKITIVYMREQTEEEAEIDRGYAHASHEAKQRQLERLQAELGIGNSTPSRRVMTALTITPARSSVRLPDRSAVRDRPKLKVLGAGGY